MEPRLEENLPQGALDELNDPGDKTDIPGNVHSIREHLRDEEDEHISKTNMPSWDRWPGSHLDELEAMGDIEDDCDHHNIVEGGGYDGRWWEMDGTTSVARCDSKWVKMEVRLAEYDTD